MNQDHGSFPFTNEQFDKLMHFIGIKIAVAFENRSPEGIEQSRQHLAAMKEDLRTALVGRSAL